MLPSPLPLPITSPKYASSPGRHRFPTPAFYAPLLLVTIATLLFGLSAVPSNVSAQSNGPKPTNMTAQVVDGGVLLNWDAPAEDASSVTGYQILRRNPWNGETELIILVADTTSTDTSYTDATATESGVRYTYGVKALRGSLKSGLSNRAFARLPEEICPEGGSDPVEVEVTAVPIVVESTTNDYFVLYVRHESGDSEVDLPVSVSLGEDGTTTLAENVTSLPKERYRVEKFSVADPADVDGDCADDITELSDPGNMNPVNPAAPIKLGAGAVAVTDGGTFEELSAQELSEAFYYLLDEDPSEGRISYMRFILFDMDTDRPGVYFANTAAWTRHGEFVDALGLDWHGIVRGEIAYQPHLVAPNDSQGVYSFRLSTFNFDHPFDVMDRAYTLLAASMPLLNDNLALHLRNYELPFSQDLLPLYRDSRIDVVFDEHIFPDTAFQALNTGEAYGLLRSRGPDERPQSREIVIYEALPNNLPRVAGIISSAPQTPLSHVNLRAVQDGLPNAFIRDAHENTDIDSLLGSFVHYTVTEDGWTLRAATPEEVETHYAAILPSQDQTPQRDLSVTSITPLSQIDFEDWDAFGVKAANVAVLNDLSFQSPTATAPNGFAVPLYFYDHVVVLSEPSSQSPPVTFPNGFAVPFYFYDEFMKANDFYDEVEQMLAVPGFHSDFDIQEAELKKLRKKIKKGTTPEWIETALTQMHATYPEGTSLRYRSSTNNEDLPGFNGAGLYDSKTQHPEETMEDGISKSLKQVYASLWNFRAFTQREFHRVDHLTTAMGVLVHPNYSDELANGVAVSFDPVYGRDGWYYVNAQLGEDLVTNPDALSTPEELLVTRYEFPVVLATSNLLPPGELLLSRSQQYQLRSHLEVIHEKFAELYDPEAGEPFAMEIEFKITSDNVLSIKQARPWVFGPAEAAGPTPLTASIHDAPENHDGQNAFTFELRFSEEPDPDLSYRTLRDHALGVTGGAVTGVRRLDSTSNVRWEITVSPESEAEVMVVLPVTTDCEDEGAICTEDGRMLSAELTLAIGPAAPPNNPATGGPTISGTSRVDETLAADTSGIGDEDGLSGATFSYQWMGNDGRTVTAIAGATGASYTLVDADEGKIIRVQVSFTDDRGNEETLSSAATATVQAPPGNPATGAPTVSGTVQVGETLAADTSGISDADGLSGATFSYQWMGNDGSGEADIAGATGASYTLVDADEGKTITVQVSFTDDRGNEETLSSAATATVQARPNNPATGAPTVSGTVQVGETLAAETSGIGDEDGLSGATFSYQWMGNDGRTVTAIAGATGASYTLVDADEGKIIRVQVSFTDDRGNEETLSSAATATVQARPNNPATGAPTVSGTVQVGETLAAETSGIGDEDGLSGATFSYQWMRNDGSTDAAIAGATVATYTLVDADEGKTVTVQVSFTDDRGNEETLSSAATAAVTARPMPLTASIHDAPENHDGQNAFTFELRFSEEPDLSYRTLRNHSFTVTGGAVTNARRLAPPGNVRWEITVLPDSDAEVTVVLPVTADCEDEGAICIENGRMLSAVATLAVGGPVEEEEQTPAENTPATGVPTISGTAQVGETLMADTSGIADADGLSNATYNYQWIRNDGSADADIHGATDSTFTLTSDDEGKSIKVRVTFTDDAGNEEELTSNAVLELAAEPTDRPHSLTATVSGDVIILTWQYTDNYGGNTYQILRHRPELGEPEPLIYVDYTQSSGSTFTDTEVEPGVLYVYRVKAVVDFFGSLGEASDAAEVRMPDSQTVSEPVPPAPAETNTPATGAPAITGMAQVGETLIADTSGIADADGLSNATYNYQWIRNDGSADADIHGAADSTFTLTSDDEGKSIKVRVTFTDDAGNGEELTSNAVLGLAAEPTDRPHSLTVTVSGDVIILTWQDTDNYRRNNYQILRHRPELGEPEPLIYVDYTQSSGSTFTDTEVEPGVLYVYRVKAVVDFFGSLGEASDAAEVRMPDSQTVLEPVPPAPAETNTPATGAPAITGVARVGETLTADTSGIADADGLSNATFSYQWMRNDGSGDADIAGATGATYTLVDADEGKTIRVRASFTDDAENEETLTSAATAAVGARPNSPATGAPTISGTAQVGETLTANTSGIADADGLSNATFSYQWMRNDGSEDTDIAGATGATYTLVDADEGKTVRVRVAFVDDRGHQETRTGAATAATVPAPDSASETEEEDGSVWSATMTAGLLYDGYGYSSFAGAAGELSDAAFDLDGVTYTIKTVVAWGWIYIMVDRELPTGLTFEVDGARFNLSDASLTTYSYASEYRWSEAETNWSEGDNVQLALYSVD